eukprot:2359664-Alexandrium_andersonii.AAC.1
MSASPSSLSTPDKRGSLSVVSEAADSETVLAKETRAGLTTLGSSSGEPIARTAAATEAVMGSVEAGASVPPPSP